MVLLRSHNVVSLFDIRLNSVEKDVIVLRGFPEDAASVLLSGMVVLSVADRLSVKRITLKLYGSCRLNWTDNVLTVSGPMQRSHRYEKVLYEHEWNNLELSSSGVTGSGGAGAGSNSSSSTASSSTHTMSQGNHEFPFEVVLPGDIPESVEGMEGGQVVYRLLATVERGRFSNNLVAKKHIRVVRTIGSDSFELSQTVSIDNTWPAKIDYSVSIPSKAVAIGSALPVKMTMVPLLKGLKLGAIKIQLAETISLASPLGATYSKEKTRMAYQIPPPEDGLEGQDSWDVAEFVSLPTSLTKVTQDCVIGQYIKISHKIKFAVSLVNPDGHVSELRASLPVYLFISPHVQISSVDPTRVTIPGTPQEEDTLFAPCTSNSHSGTHTPNEVAGSFTELRALDASLLDNNAPPNYQDHIYDRLWGDIPASSLESPPTRSPGNSGGSTPFIASRRGSIDQDGPLALTALDPQHRSQLAAGLRALERQQELQQEGSSSADNTGSANSRSTSSPATPFVVMTQAPNDYFSLHTVAASGAQSSPDFLHMSRAASPLYSPIMGPSRVESGVDLEVLSRVPSYSTALKSDTGDGDWAPGYDDPPSSSSVGSHTNGNNEGISPSSSFGRASRVGLPQTNTGENGAMSLSRNSSCSHCSSAIRVPGCCLRRLLD